MGKIEIKKVDEADDQITSAVATFKIEPNPYTGSGSLTVTDNESEANYDKNTAIGYIQLINVIPGDYDITETIAPTGYVIVDTAAKSVNVTCDSTDPLPVTFVNEVCGLQIEKRDWDTGDIVNRPGLIVRVTPHPYDETKEYLDVVDNVYPDTHTTYDGQTTGYGTILLLDINCALCYRIEEIQAPVGYNLDSQPVDNVCPGSIQVVILYNTQSEGECETAFAYHGVYDGECFSHYGFSNWGWSIGPLSEGEYYFAIYAGAAQCDISKGALIGQLSVIYDGSTAWVTYIMTSGFTMNETHLYVGLEPLPRDNKGDFTVAPGQYPFINDPTMDPELDGYKITGLSGPIHIVAHAVVCGAYND